MAILQPLVDLAAICYAQGVRHVVVSPGSRSAALTLAFTRFGRFTIHVCMDERSAGFIGLGIAQQTGVPVVLICTSGSAVYNFAPAVSEAFFQHIPLLVISADRPKEWLHQYDGQTIYQNEIFGKHIKRSFEFSADYGHADVKWAINRMSNEAVTLTSTVPMGPVHINVPIREPFYPALGEEMLPSADLKIIKRQPAEMILAPEVWNALLDEFEEYPKILIAAGQNMPDHKLSEVLNKISEEWDIPVLADSIGNVSGVSIIRNHDLFLSSKNAEDLVPDLLITFGLSFISKDFKQFIRKNPPKAHWHIGEDAFLADPTQSLTRTIPVSPDYFFKNLYEKIDYQLFIQNSDPETDSSFLRKWSAKDLMSAQIKRDYCNNLPKLSDLTSLDSMFKYIDRVFQLHVANSMSVRYINLLDLGSNVRSVFCNRGTSGIDGCVSTAIGAALVNEEETLLVVGDVAFMYDRNGLLINTLLQNLKIVVINNAGGNIFRMIDGPSGLPEIETYFETRHAFSARRTCEDSNIAYFSCKEFEALEHSVKAFLENKGIALLEIFTDPYENETVWKELRKLGREQ
ncbi:2-succinyl-5-enolpyruvyl-6-hydroxy-3-cyclohexene-1-carboxylic-acid synthase [Dyadobacter fanqingshengii]|uniref:2-succinyl-5-enolpyruvyl-6-hydroxy-3-cyclohexene-1-carboxylate synthase n=1 Tax=Dyadobacter fanqingshengii TaxID=2906443 RepID=A0A9X1T9T1_9BACT|nr:2-succinyl-5-enolpyruvyl-6-hydroxy-3-cyclohexene-1-carboxylic-acid synthase [Dyadobacter fanqingshengii]MCF0040986.1 2-succinyl-5-enolpyruvyl-6-hydroxy-3-cyclohexene-1-carboxylic-acid synthase [Dyadobacter fanqingshengii]USJ37283.1 2-succinyl-5-enolpyruvyl-6-hydroxy-3-cyclohexene-1-carboxylic-acid synthase [Dyadobacter fanqingshengii]